MFGGFLIHVHNSLKTLNTQSWRRRSVGREVASSGQFTLKQHGPAVLSNIYWVDEKGGGEWWGATNQNGRR